MEDEQQLTVGNRLRSVVRQIVTIAALPVLVMLLIDQPDEPVFGGDANRHVMTSVFFRDLIVDGGFTDPKTYAEDYFDQYPALSLLHFPPLFHGVVGGLMSIFGTSVMVARVFNFACFVTSCWLLYLLVRRRNSAELSQVAVTLFALMPMTLDYSRYVMLEMPTLMLCLLCVERFDVWLRGRSTRPLYVAAVAASLAALTRFDAIVLLPTLLLMAAFEGQARRLFGRHVLAASIVALILVSPTYGLIWYEKGDMHLRQAVESVGGESSKFLTDGCWSFYPVSTTEQAGWVIPLFACIGLLVCLFRGVRNSAPFLALLLATYLTFTPLAELRARHAIYWLPALAYFASIGISAIIERLGRVENTEATANAQWQKLVAACICYAAVFVGTTHATLQHPAFVVSGYRHTADVVLQRTKAGDVVLVDAWWDGNFTYHVRHLDADRSRRIVRGDQIFYDFLSVPNIDFQAFVETDLDILKAIRDSNATCVVFEDPQPFGHIPLSQKFRQLVARQPRVFPPVEDVSVSLKFPQARPFELRILDVNADGLCELIEHMESKQAVNLHTKEN